MAIQTRGFGVDVMPQYSPVNPSLVAFNPSQAMSGAMDMASLVKAIEKIKADRAALEELNALKSKRMAAAAAGYDTDIARADAFNPLMPKQASLLGAEIDSKLSLIPNQTLLASGEIGNKLSLLNLSRGAEAARLNSTINTTPYVDSAVIADAKVRANNAPTLGALELAKADLGMFETRAARNMAPTKELLGQMEGDAAIANAPSNISLNKLLLADKIAEAKNAPTARAIKADDARAEADLKRAQARLADANAWYVKYEKGSEDPFKQFAKIGARESQLTSEENRLKNQRVTLPRGGVGTYVDYEDTVYGGNGDKDAAGVNLDKTWYLHKSKESPILKTADGERIRAELLQITAEKQFLHQLKSKLDLGFRYDTATSAAKNVTKEEYEALKSGDLYWWNGTQIPKK